MKIILPNERPISWNQYYGGMHWSKRNEEAKRVHKLVKYSLRPMERRMMNRKVDIMITVYFKNRPFDSDNIASKLYIDGLKGLIINDDTREFVRSVTTRSEVDKENPRLEIEII